MKENFKKILPLVFFLVTSHTILGQVYFNPDALKAANESKTYFGLASGVESFAGMIGLSLEGNVARNFSLYAGAGLGGWGYKLSGGVKIYRSFPYRWAYCASLSHASGLKDFKTKMETSSGSQDVVMDLLSCQTFNLTAQHHWKIGNRNNRFNVEFGLSLALTQDAYKVKNGVVLTDQSANLMKVLQPGGLTAGIGFSFGR